jgi:phage protein D/phage baseplate assembly protein gpV
MNNQSSVKTHQVAIKRSGSFLANEVMDTLEYVEVETVVNMPASFLLRFHLGLHPETMLGMFSLGDEIVIQFNNASDVLTEVLKAEVTSVEPEFYEDMTAALVVRGYHKGHRLNRGVKARTFVQVKDSDVVSTLCSEVSLSAQSKATTEVYPIIAQAGVSNLALLQELADRNGYELRFEGNNLYFRPPQETQPISLKWGSSMRRFSPRLSAGRQVNQVTVRGWDPKQKREIVGVSSSSAGGSAAQAVFGDAKHLEVRRQVTSQASATALAQAIHKAINAGYKEAEGVAMGNADLVAGKAISVTQFGDRFNGTYYLTSARHVYTPQGYDVYFTAEGRRPFSLSNARASATAPASPPLSGWWGVYTALVSNNNPPDADMLSVKVKFPWLDDTFESGWARVVAPGAGSQRGLQWIPEVNDEVLVAFENGDFTRPYVLGGVWNGTDAAVDAASAAVSGGKVNLRKFKSRTGHTITFDDTEGATKLIIQDGKQKVTITLEADGNKLTIDCQGETTITSQGKISLKGQADIDITAQGKLTLKGSGGFLMETGANGDVKAGGILNVKGSMVNIN